jgi:myo-inositol-1(or 4)-monophosphatase
MTEIEFIKGILPGLAGFVRERYTAPDALEVAEKGDPNDLLTEVDLAVQRQTAGFIAETFPGDLFVSEEEGLDRTPKDPNCRCWVMDPIDGTQNFVRGMFPAFGISLAFAKGGEVVAGGVSVPMLDALFLAEKGEGAYCNGAELAVSDMEPLDCARLEVDFGRLDGRNQVVDAALTMMRSAGQIRCHCAAVIGLCSIATGDIDAYVHAGLKPWDFAASQLILEEAGGTITDFDCNRLPLFGPLNGVLASNGLLHDELRALLPK